MGKKLRLILKSCNHRLDEPSGGDLSDGLSELPDEVLLSILSSFTMKEVARIGFLSQRWRNLWRKCSKLNFENLRSMEKIGTEKTIIGQERSNFVNWVNRVVEQHLGPMLDEFTATYDLDASCEFHVDKWVNFAFAKQVKRLVLDFTPACRFRRGYNGREPLCGLNLELPHKHSLVSLCLKYVNITSEGVECLLRSCPLLESLRIEWSRCLTSIRASSDLSLVLKHLEVQGCDRLEAIDICAPMLLSFRYWGTPIELHIRSASSLSEVWIAVDISPITHAFYSLSKYFSQLEILKLRMHFDEDTTNMGIIRCPTLTNLKQLEMMFSLSWEYQSLLGWIPLIEASPALETLTLKFRCFIPRDRHPSLPVMVRKRKGRPLKCLKTLKLTGFLGRDFDLGIAIHVLENAVLLQELVIEVTSKPWFYAVARERALNLQKHLPQGAKLIVKDES